MLLVTKFSFTELLAWEDSLRPGDLVKLRWTSCQQYTAQAEIVKINQKSIRAKLLRRVGELTTFHERGVTVPAYEAGREILVPRAEAKGWSFNNGAFPLYSD